MFGEMVPLDVGLHTQLAGLGGLLSDGDLSIAAWSDCCYDAHTHFATIVYCRKRLSKRVYFYFFTLTEIILFHIHVCT
jgi:hypothetical protein